MTNSAQKFQPVPGMDYSAYKEIPGVDYIPCGQNPLAGRVEGVREVNKTTSLIDTIVDFISGILKAIADFFSGDSQEELVAPLNGRVEVNPEIEAQARLLMDRFTKVSANHRVSDQHQALALLKEADALLTRQEVPELRALVNANKNRLAAEVQQHIDAIAAQPMDQKALVRSKTEKATEFVAKIVGLNIAGVPRLNLSIHSMERQNDLWVEGSRLLQTLKYSDVDVVNEGLVKDVQRFIRDADLKINPRLEALVKELENRLEGYQYMMEEDEEAPEAAAPKHSPAVIHEPKPVALPTNEYFREAPAQKIYGLEEVRLLRSEIQKATQNIGSTSSMYVAGLIDRAPVLSNKKSSRINPLLLEELKGLRDDVEALRAASIKNEMPVIKQERTRNESVQRERDSLAEKDIFTRIKGVFSPAKKPSVETNVKPEQDLSRFESQQQVNVALPTRTRIGNIANRAEVASQKEEAPARKKSDYEELNDSWQNQSKPATAAVEPSVLKAKKLVAQRDAKKAQDFRIRSATLRS